MDSAKSQLIDRLKTASSVLVTVSRNPSVDQLAACIGLTLLINKMGKHGSAVFSGEVPSTIEFLKPEETIEKTADSLRDFIIALDKSKADKLRYKVEDQTVKIFITPYKTSLSDKDLEFSQGDFNVELVIALGVNKQDDLDEAIVSHGRILHDATVANITTAAESDLGSISWRDQVSSSLCELVTDLAAGLGDNLIDEQIATALLTGIIAETDRFSNEKTSSQTMSVSAKLMAAGANQQLVATNLNEPPAPVNLKVDESNPDSDGNPKASVDDGTLSIKHDDVDLDLTTLPPPSEGENNDDLPTTPKVVTQPPALGGTLTANSAPEEYDPSTDPLSGHAGQPEPTLSRTRPFGSELNDANSPSDDLPKSPAPPAFRPPPPSWAPPAAPSPEPPPTVAPQPIVPPVPQAQPPAGPPPPVMPPNAKDQTIDQLEVAVGSPHVNVKNARKQVEDILAQSPDNAPAPRSDLNAEPLGQPLHQADQPDTGDNAPPVNNASNTTGLDPSLFSEPPKNNGDAPPVPPPVQYPLNGDNFGPDNQNK